MGEGIVALSFAIYHLFDFLKQSSLPNNLLVYHSLSTSFFLQQISSKKAFFCISNMFRAFLLLSLALYAAAFTGFTSKRSSTAQFAKSKALPFLEAPPKLDGTMVGDQGFDPLGLTNTLQSLHYVRSSELKHGRVAMLACVGFVLQQYIHILNGEADPIKAISAIGYGPNLQILSFIGVIELATWDKNYDSNTEPGNLGFDPLNFSKGKSASQMNDLKLKEIKNGRLAMVAIIGMLVQNLQFNGQATLSF